MPVTYPWAVLREIPRTGLCFPVVQTRRPSFVEGLLLEIMCNTTEPAALACLNYR